MTAPRIGKYEVQEYLGSGGMSDVYAAMHTGLRRRVAIKVLRTALRDDHDAVERFLREGECAARVCHPNVVSVHDVGVEEGVPYLIMELLEGETLEEKLVREGAMRVEDAVDLLLPLFDAIDHVHRAGVIHRDVKPANILLARYGDGSVTPKLMDFGVATLNERRLITASLGPIGTPTYMSPEQARGLDPVDARSDQYSLASVLFETLTGREPFPGADVETVIDHVVRGRFPRLYEGLRTAPHGLDEALRRATAYDPRDRFYSVREFADAIAPFASERALEARRMRAEMSLPASESMRAMRGPQTERNSQITLRVRPSQPRVMSAFSSTRHRGAVIASVGLLALALGVGVGVVSFDGSRSVASGSADLATSEVEEEAPQVPAVAREPADSAQRPLSKAPGGHTLVALPAYAEVFLDDQLLGRGTVQLPALEDEQLHELRITAKGHVPRVLLFKQRPALSQVLLKSKRP